VGLVGAVVIVCLNLWYMKIALRRSIAAGDGYSDSGATDPGPTIGVAVRPPKLGLSLLPPIVLLVLLNALKLDPLVALMSAGMTCVVLFWRRYVNLLQTLNRGATNTVLPIVNTCADVGYGVSIATTSGFKVVSDWLLALPGNPIMSLAAATGLMAGIAGSASGGLGIVLETLAPKYLALGLNPDLVHRISVMAAGTFDALPHNGAVITTLAVANLTHRTAYRHVWWGHVVATIITVLVVLPVGILIYS
jgi:H+/gluconate symporter-like permease